MKLFGLIGFPLKNSFSETYFAQKFKLLGVLDHAYQNFPIRHLSELNHILKEQPDLLGINVTIPHKEGIISFLDELDHSAEIVGAVNCIKITPTKLIGYNTDIYGFEQSLLPLIANQHVQDALILGTGGSAKAVAYVLAKHNINFQYVSRTKKQNQLTYEELNTTIISTHKLIINCTPLGMFPDIDAAPNIPYESISNKHILYDLIYLPSETLFLTKGKLQGAQIKNGLEMLELQADKSWEIWNNR